MKAFISDYSRDGTVYDWRLFLNYNRFVLQPVSYIRKELEEKLQSNEEKIKNIEVSA